MRSLPQPQHDWLRALRCFFFFFPPFPTRVMQAPPSSSIFPRWLARYASPRLSIVKFQASDPGPLIGPLVDARNTVCLASAFLFLSSRNGRLGPFRVPALLTLSSSALHFLLDLATDTLVRPCLQYAQVCSTKPTPLPTPHSLF